MTYLLWISIYNHIGETDPAKSLPGTIRGDFCVQIGRNICHGSDSVESAKVRFVYSWFDLYYT
jgi:nucleoside-diphosphate kinase